MQHFSQEKGLVLFSTSCASIGGIDKQDLDIHDISSSVARLEKVLC